MNYYQKQTPLIYKIICVIVISLFGFLIFSLILYFLQKKYEFKRDAILKNPVVSIGFVYNKMSYKGHSFNVEYFVNNERFTINDGVSEECYQKYKSGDNIKIIYNKIDPSQAILLEDLNKSNGRNNNK
jgi:hypothetical protein